MSICAIPQNQASAHLPLDRPGLQLEGASRSCKLLGFGTGKQLWNTLFIKWAHHCLTHNFFFLSPWVDPEAIGELSQCSALGTSCWTPSKCMKSLSIISLQAIVYNSTSFWFFFFFKKTPRSISLWSICCTIKAKGNFGINLNMVMVLAAPFGPPVDISHRSSWLKHGLFISLAKSLVLCWKHSHITDIPVCSWLKTEPMYFPQDYATKRSLFSSLRLLLSLAQPREIMWGSHVSDPCLGNNPMCTCQFNPIKALLFSLKSPSSSWEFGLCNTRVWLAPCQFTSSLYLGRRNCSLNVRLIPPRVFLLGTEDLGFLLL